MSRSRIPFIALALSIGCARGSALDEAVSGADHGAGAAAGAGASASSSGTGGNGAAGTRDGAVDAGAGGESGNASSDGEGGTAGASGGAGAGGAGATGGVAGATGSGGVAGTGSGGVAGTTGSGGVAGATGSGGVAGATGSGGVAGTTGSGGVAGTGSAAGTGGTASGGTTGTLQFDWTAIEDTYASNDGSEANDNFGTSAAILVDGDPKYRLFLQVPSLVSALPAGAVIDAATLTLTCYDTGGLVRLFRVLEAWDEQTLTWDDQPAYDATEVTSFTPVCGSGAEIAIDLTAAVRAWGDGAPNCGVVLVSTVTSSGGGSDYRSTEYGTASARPRVSLEYHVP